MVKFHSIFLAGSFFIPFVSFVFSTSLHENRHADLNFWRNVLNIRIYDTQEINLQNIESEVGSSFWDEDTSCVSRVPN